MYDVTVMPHFAFQIHYNVDNGRASIYVGCLYETAIVLVGPKRTARTFRFNVVCVLEIVISPSWSILLSKYKCTTINDHDDSAVIFVGLLDVCPNTNALQSMAMTTLR